MRIATYNVEWFSSLFDRDNQLVQNNDWSGRRDVTKAVQAKALGAVFRAIDADAVLVVEAPDSSRRRSSTIALENFARSFDLRIRRAISGFSSETQQEISLLYDPDKFEARHAPLGAPTGKKGSHKAPRFDGVFRWQLDSTAKSELVRFSKPPLEIVLTPNLGVPLRLIGVHAKSKAPHGAKNKAEEIRISIANRRKQLAQCVWIRQRVDHHLGAGDRLIVLGDFNDGPGLDEYEKLFGRSGVEVIMGCDGPKDEMLYDPYSMATQSLRPGPLPSTSRFYIHQEKRFLNALLDYVMITPNLRAGSPRWHIWHPFDDPHCYDDQNLRQALLSASDHFPVTLDIDL